MKALLLNSKQEKSDQLYDDNAVGPSYRFVVTNMNDEKFVLVGSQTYQSSYMSLQLPYYYTGIGRSNNYVETFYAVIGIEGKRAERMWTPIIPNS